VVVLIHHVDHARDERTVPRCCWESGVVVVLIDHVDVASARREAWWKPRGGPCARWHVVVLQALEQAPPDATGRCGACVCQSLRRCVAHPWRGPPATWARHARDAHRGEAGDGATYGWWRRRSTPDTARRVGCSVPPRPFQILNHFACGVCRVY
jgi:hypothetical protein